VGESNRVLSFVFSSESGYLQVHCIVVYKQKETHLYLFHGSWARGDRLVDGGQVTTATMGNKSRVPAICRFVRVRWVKPAWFFSIFPYLASLFLGSWDGRIRFWKLDSSLRSFSPVGSIDAPGLINSLQLIATPKDWASDEGWPAPTKETATFPKDVVKANGIAPHDSPNGRIPRSQSGVLVVAAVGQEPRLGRWIRLNGGGVVNSALICSLRTRKTTG
jgi:hypothetical protein